MMSLQQEGRHSQDERVGQGVGAGSYKFIRADCYIFREPVSWWLKTAIINN